MESRHNLFPLYSVSEMLHRLGWADLHDLAICLVGLPSSMGAHFPPSLFIYLFICPFVFSRAAPAAYGVPRLGVESELQPPAYTTATATRDLSHICDLHHSSWQRQFLNPLSKVRDRTRILMDTSGVCYH